MNAEKKGALGVPNDERRECKYNPMREAAERWPGWAIEEVRLDGDAEVFLHRENVIMLDLARWDGDRDWAWTHSLVHLEERHVADESGCFTEEARKLCRVG